MLLIPISLRKLSLLFSTIENKGVFPFKLTDINYIGPFPKFEYWVDIEYTKWTELKVEHSNKIWSFKEESIKYCKLYCLILHEILVKFNEYILNIFNINIQKVLTLPSLAIRIFKCRYMKENQIYQLHGLPSHLIRKSYTGGAIDVYVPHNKLVII